MEARGRSREEFVDLVSRQNILHDEEITEGFERDNASARLISIRSVSERAASHGRRSLIKSHLRSCVRFQRMGGYLAKSANMMRHEANKPVSPAPGIFSPLRYAVFRRIWTASLLSNLGLLVLGVGAAWSMTKISSSTSMVALVQTSLMLPVALVSTPAGAIAICLIGGS